MCFKSNHFVSLLCKILMVFSFQSNFSVFEYNGNGFNIGKYMYMYTLIDDQYKRNNAFVINTTIHFQFCLTI